MKLPTKLYLVLILLVGLSVLKFFSPSQAFAAIPIGGTGCAGNDQMCDGGCSVCNGDTCAGGSDKYCGGQEGYVCPSSGNTPCVLGQPVSTPVPMPAGCYVGRPCAGNGDCGGVGGVCDIPHGECQSCGTVPPVPPVPPVMTYQCLNNILYTFRDGLPYDHVPCGENVCNEASGSCVAPLPPPPANPIVSFKCLNGVLSRYENGLWKWDYPCASGYTCDATGGTCQPPTGQPDCYVGKVCTGNSDCGGVGGDCDVPHAECRSCGTVPPVVPPAPVCRPNISGCNPSNPQAACGVGGKCEFLEQNYVCTLCSSLPPAPPSGCVLNVTVCTTANASTVCNGGTCGANGKCSACVAPQPPVPPVPPVPTVPPAPPVPPPPPFTPPGASPVPGGPTNSITVLGPTTLDSQGLFHVRVRFNTNPAPSGSGANVVKLMGAPTLNLSQSQVAATLATNQCSNTFPTGIDSTGKGKIYCSTTMPSNNEIEVIFNAGASGVKYLIATFYNDINKTGASYWSAYATNSQWSVPVASGIIPLGGPVNSISGPANSTLDSQGREHVALTLSANPVPALVMGGETASYVVKIIGAPLTATYEGIKSVFATAPCSTNLPTGGAAYCSTTMPANLDYIFNSVGGTRQLWAIFHNDAAHVAGSYWGNASNSWSVPVKTGPISLSSGVGGGAGDTNGNGCVGARDLGYVYGHYQTSSQCTPSRAASAPAASAGGDFNNDGCVDDLDLSVVSSRFSYSCNE